MSPAEKDTVIFILPSIHHVLRGEKLLIQKKLPFDLIPVPKEVNPDCGMALETSPNMASALNDALVEAGLPVEAVFRRRGRDFIKIESGTWLKIQDPTQGLHGGLKVRRVAFE